MSGLKDAGHLFRFAGLFVVAFLVFLVVRGYVVPKTFGQYGHYRGAAMGEIAQHPVKFAGHQTCESCHSDIADTKTKGAHAHVNCEACHGALYQRLPAPPQPKGNLYQRFVALIVPPLPPDPPILLHADDPASVVPDEAGHIGAVRALPHGQRGQAQGLSAGGSDRSHGRRSLRNLP